MQVAPSGDWNINWHKLCHLVKFVISVSSDTWFWGKYCKTLSQKDCSSYSSEALLYPVALLSGWWDTKHCIAISHGNLNSNTEIIWWATSEIVSLCFLHFIWYSWVICCKTSFFAFFFLWLQSGALRRLSSVQRFPFNPNPKPSHNRPGQTIGLKWTKIDENGWNLMKMEETWWKWMEMDENIRYATCISDAVF